MSGDETPKLDPTVLDLYKVAVEMADRISARRSTANAFFLSVQTAFVAVLGIATPTLRTSPWWTSLAVATAGFILSVSWWLQLRSYRDLNRAKFAVINKIEEELPKGIFSDEWTYLKRDPIPGWRGRYAELGTIERIVPWVFASLYILLFMGRIFQ
ncbi:RipA family octameric membrane protein [Actinomadura nitritigenes]|uniref:RipA family octameric membrane protein n=1 Tax=Actinomadura nitritigenes TaxID=134602 RepID=UPI003D8F138D